MNDYWLLVEEADYVSLVAADPAHPRSPRFDVVMRKLLAFIASNRAFDPFFGRRLPGLIAAIGLVDAGHDTIARHRQGRSAAAEMLARSLENTRDRTLRHGVVDAGEFEAVLAALRDPLVRLRGRAERRRVRPGCAEGSRGNVSVTFAV
jgi:hypothetical protein